MLTFKDAIRVARRERIRGVREGCCFGSPLRESYRDPSAPSPSYRKTRRKKAKKAKKIGGSRRRNR